MRGLCERLLLKIMSVMMPLDGGCLRRLVDRCSTTGGSTAFLSPIPIFLPFSFVSVASQTAPCLIQRSSRRARFALGRRSMAGGTGLIAASGGVLFLLTEDDVMFSAEEPTADMRITYST